MNFKKIVKEKYFQLSILLISVFIFLISFKKGAIYINDSPGYLEMDILRSMVYPMFLKVIQLLSKNNFEALVVTFQLLFGLFAAFFSIKQFQKHFKLHKLLLIFFYVLLLAPYLQLHLIGNKIMSESLAYPLYLIVFSKLLGYLIKNSTKSFIQICILTLILILTRAQFLFLIPILSIILVYNYFQTKQLKKYGILLIVTISIPFISSITDKIYHKIAHDYYINTPWTGLQIVTLPFFVAQEDQAAIFEDPNQKAYFNLIYQILKEKGYNLHHLKTKESKERLDEFYDYKYSTISYDIIFKEGMEFANQFDMNRFEKYIYVDQLTSSMTIPLIKANLKDYIKIYIMNISRGFGSKKVMLLWGFILIYSLLNFFQKRDDLYKIFIVLSLAVIGNLMIVTIAEHTTKRFLFYNNWNLFLVITLLIHQYHLKIHTHDS